MCCEILLIAKDERSKRRMLKVTPFFVLETLFQQLPLGLNSVKTLRQGNLDNGKKIVKKLLGRA